MPKQTFLNLPESKKNTIIEIAIDEFAEYDFTSASINRIVEKANIAKGSFYQYFTDKLDLFSYVIDSIGVKKMEYFFNNELLKEKDKDFFIYLKTLFDLGLEFAIKNPRFSAIGDKLYKNDALRKKIYGELETKSYDFMKQLILQGQSVGSIRKDINVDLATHLLLHLNFSLGEIYYKTHDEWHDNEKFHKLTNDVIDILQNGIKK